MRNRQHESDESTDRKRTFLGRYEYYGGFGANWISHEDGVEVGTVRCINRVLHEASIIHRRVFGLDEVCWARVDRKVGMD